MLNSLKIAIKPLISSQDLCNFKNIFVRLYESVKTDNLSDLSYIGKFCTKSKNVYGFLTSLKKPLNVKNKPKSKTNYNYYQ